jgi:serine/threonine protein kinase
LLLLLQVAIKVMPKQRGKLTRERTLQKLMKEVGILQKMQECRNTVRILGCFEGSDEVMVVTQYCSGGDLQKLSDVSAQWQQQQQPSGSSSQVAAAVVAPCLRISLAGVGSAGLFSMSFDFKPF